MTVYGTPSRQESGLPCLYLHTMCLQLSTSLHCWAILLREKGCSSCAVPSNTMQLHILGDIAIMCMRIIVAAAYLFLLPAEAGGMSSLLERQGLLGKTKG